VNKILNSKIDKFLVLLNKITIVIVRKKDPRDLNRGKFFWDYWIFDVNF